MIYFMEYQKEYSMYNIKIEYEDDRCELVFGALYPTFINNKLVYYMYNEETELIDEVVVDLNFVTGFEITKADGEKE